jgi:hypothetical protein
MIKITILLISISVFVSCNNKSNQSSNQEITYDLEGGYKAFMEDTTSNNDSLAKEQALYLVENYGEDGITQLAPGIKPWLKTKGMDYDSIHKKVIQDREDFDKRRKETEANSLHNGISGNADDAYEKIHVAFEGMPDIDKVKPMLEAVMTRYNIVINNDNVLKCANVLVTLKNDSKIGVTEMDILKHMYQRGSASVDYPTQAAISSQYLEETK